MFTGLVEEIGTIAALVPTPGGMRVGIRARTVRDGLAVGTRSPSTVPA